MTVVSRLTAFVATYGLTASLAVAVGALFWGIPALALPAALVAVAIDAGRDLLNRASTAADTEDAR